MRKKQMCVRKMQHVLQHCENSKVALHSTLEHPSKMKLIACLAAAASASPIVHIINGQEIDSIEDAPWQVSLKPAGTYHMNLSYKPSSQNERLFSGISHVRRKYRNFEACCDGSALLLHSEKFASASRQQKPNGGHSVHGRFVCQLSRICFIRL